MSLEGTLEEDEVETADEGDDPSPPTPHPARRDPVVRLSEDVKEHQLQAIVGVGRNKYPHKHFRVYASHKKGKTPDISATHAKSPCIKEIASQRKKY
jgi:hypothetical protein